MKREYWIGIVVAALVVVGVVVGISLAGGGDDGDAPTSITGTEEVQAQLDGVPQAGNVLGDPDAPVEIIEYGDLACPACQLASETTIPEVVDSLVKPGDAKMVFRPDRLHQPQLRARRVRRRGGRPCRTRCGRSST